MNDLIDDNELLAQPLSRSEQHFVAEYCINGYNATKAYQSAHPKASPETARSNGYRMLTKAHIVRAIDDFCIRSVDGRQAILKKRIVDILEVQAFYKITDIMDIKTGRIKMTNEELEAAGLTAVIESVNEKNTKDAKSIEYRFSDRLAAIDMLCRIVGLYDTKLTRGGLGESENVVGVILGVGKIPIEEWNARGRAKSDELASQVLGKSGLLRP